jgi:hypothetical protein
MGFEWEFWELYYLFTPTLFISNQIKVKTTALPITETIKIDISDLLAKTLLSSGLYLFFLAQSTIVGKRDEEKTLTAKISKTKGMVIYQVIKPKKPPDPMNVVRKTITNEKIDHNVAECFIFFIFCLSAELAGSCCSIILLYHFECSA